MMRLAGIGVLIGLALASGCGRSSRVAEENQRLRFEVIELQNQLESQQQRNQELQQELRQAATAPQTLPEDIRAVIPHVISLSIEKLSFARDTDGDGKPDLLTLYIKPTDGRGRFEQLVGTLSAAATLIPQNAEPVSIGRVQLTPAQVRDAYRSSITGTHYTVELPIQIPEGLDEKQAFVRVVYADGRTGQELAAERIIELGDGR